ncbi:MAG: hypothetical protein N3B13_09275, partial [Deltaproteobacteria bacterium]|nr:hypothetical protein [Deltaproteobacteria bacterium]
VEKSLKKSSIAKRIQTLIASGLLTECESRWKLSDKLIDRGEVRKNINASHEKSHSKKRSLLCLTSEQNRLIEDLKDFLNLSGSQILKYIYQGNEVLYKSDIRYLIEKDILIKDKISDTYILTKSGTKFAAGLTGEKKKQTGNASKVSH